MEDYVKRALELGFNEIGFADHAPVNDGFDPVHRMTWDEFPLYVETVERLRGMYSQIQIRLGVEADIYPGFELSLQELSNAFPIEYVIGSVHFIDSDPVFFYDVKPRTDSEIQNFIKDYYQRLILGVRSGLLDAIAHVDVIKWHYPDWKDFIGSQADSLFAEIQKAGMALELNTSGIRKKPAESYPGLKLIRLAAAYKIPMILGADAHEPRHVGADYHRAGHLLQEAGYHHLITFRSKLQAYAVQSTHV